MRLVTIVTGHVPRAVLKGGQGQLVKWVSKLSGCERGFYIYYHILLIHQHLHVLEKANDNHIYEHYKYMYQAI